MPPSLKIKIYSTLWIGLLYSVTLLLGIYDLLLPFPIELKYALLYFVMVFANCVSVMLLKFEFGKGEP